MNNQSSMARKLYRDKWDKSYIVEVEELEDNQVRIYYPLYENGKKFNQIVSKQTLDGHYEEIQDEEIMKIIDYKEMLYKAVEAWLRDCCSCGDSIEDHHAIIDVQRMLDCSKEIAEELVREIGSRNKNLIADTGEIKW